MFKKATAAIMALTMTCSALSVSASAFAAEHDTELISQEFSSSEELLSMIESEGNLESDNFVLQELIYELENEIQVEDGTVSPQWVASGVSETSDHGIIAAATMSEFTSYTTSEKNTIKQCLVFAANKADNTVLHNSSAGITQLHAKYNYIANLKALWKYAKLVQYSDVDTRVKTSSFLSKMSQRDKDDLDILLETIPEIFTLYKNYYGKSSLSNLEKKHLVMGLALHLIGDIYAHRTLVPAYYANNPTYYFDSSDFINFSDFISEVATGTVLPTQITSTYMIQSISQKNRKYEDNKYFMPERFTYSKISAVNFVYEIQISGNDFDADYLEQSSNTVLYAFNTFRNRASC